MSAGTNRLLPFRTRGEKPQSSAATASIPDTRCRAPRSTLKAEMTIAMESHRADETLDQSISKRLRTWGELDRVRKEARDGEQNESEKRASINLSKRKAIRDPRFRGSDKVRIALRMRRGASQIPRPGSELAGYADHEAVVGKIKKGSPTLD
ncbi:hypothetical protein MKX07_005911 [Trichoderma sp. CBMAI-0711]|uniref:Uncharacterized protein n=1 Tax=Trichoderma parareesei TaxID=858221 RepID=A0A2H3A8X3_TRIPA|nr:hypothetical protein MKX07_005911 [Trichoderma sp. CBMAI-0711]OTA07574.1 hypothetical protein A9Z42_0084930 [Trichoderma parareesei]